MAKFEIENFPNGTKTLRNLALNECMHSSIGPWIEANLIYIEQSQLLERISINTDEPLVVYDIGLGIAVNPLALIESLTRVEVKRPVHIISFETEIEGLESALANPSEFPFLEKETVCITQLLKKKFTSKVLSSGHEIHWSLELGDFRNSISRTQPADLIYFDLFSPKNCSALWGYQTFNLLFKAVKAKVTSGPKPSLITYSASTSVRTALLLAGFSVGIGKSTSGKKETTIATTERKSLLLPLKQKWLDHWSRSSQAIPPDSPIHDRTLLYKELSTRIN